MIGERHFSRGEGQFFGRRGRYPGKRGIFSRKERLELNLLGRGFKERWKKALLEDRFKKSFEEKKNQQKPFKTPRDARNSVEICKNDVFYDRIVVSIRK